MSNILLITGASRGIGAATARACVSLFDRIIVTYCQQREAADTLVAELAQQVEANAMQVDVSNEASVLTVFEKIDTFNGALTGLVNSAGIVAPMEKLENIERSRIERMFAINVFGTLFCCREAVKRMSAGGSIVNIGSGASKHGAPGEYIDYAASKGAVDVLTMGLAKEVADKNIRVNCVRPGLIDTDIHADSGDRDRPQKLKHLVPLQRPGRAEEVAAAVRWLLSDESTYTTGSFIDVTGGR